jgi:uncharacterized coiled-coil DUF342 family protein
MTSQDPIQMLKNLEESLQKISIEHGKEGHYTAAQLDDMAKELRRQVDELKAKSEEIQKRTGMTRDQLEEYTSNPDNFSKEEWETISRIRDSIDNFKRQIWSTARGPEARSTTTPASAALKEGKSRRDHWIPS